MRLHERRDMGHNSWDMREASIDQCSITRHCRKRNVLAQSQHRVIYCTRWFTLRGPYRNLKLDVRLFYQLSFKIRKLFVPNSCEGVKWRWTDHNGISEISTIHYILVRYGIFCRNRKLTANSEDETSVILNVSHEVLAYGHLKQVW